MAAPTFGAAGAQFTGFVNTQTPAVPTGTAANEVVLLFVYSEATATLTWPSGFTQKGLANVTGTGAHQQLVAWKRCTTTDSGTYSITVPGSTYAESIAVRFSGCITTGDPFDLFVTAIGTGTGGISPAVSGTTTQTDELLLVSATNFNGGAWTPASGTTERVDYSGDLSVDTLVQAAAGATGSLTLTCAGGATGMSTILGSLLSTTSTGGSAAPIPMLIMAGPST